MAYSSQGLSQMSHAYHKLYRYNLCRGQWKERERPIIINNWEATYFDFDEEKLIQLAKNASELGVNTFVMDDGWFGHRDDDTTSLGDWMVDTKKLKRGLKPLVDSINSLGMNFGIWFEPEMISENSELYSNHPDWCLHVDHQQCSLSRNQLVIDMTRKDVRDFLFDSIAAILDSANITLPPERQKEVFHRFVLGTYELLERLTERYPHVLFEGCSGGGGRFDPGMLYYSPQIWTSDDTDALERVHIQEGTSLVYPMSSVVAHVSACPNHQTMRTTNFSTRCHVALTGSVGFELDLSKLSIDEKQLVKSHCDMYHRHASLMSNGKYYRLVPSYNKQDYAAWSYVSGDQKQVLLIFVRIFSHANNSIVRIALRGLNPKMIYSDGKGVAYHGDTLMNIGLPMPSLSDGSSYICFLQSD
jgi:alpha-galactosidase